MATADWNAAAAALRTTSQKHGSWAPQHFHVPTMEQIIETHDMIREKLNARFGPQGAQMRVLYGGSVKPTNAAEIFQAENVDGALVGGASLKASDFQPIIDALAAS